VSAWKASVGLAGQRRHGSVTFATGIAERLSEVCPNKHYSGVYGLMKLTLPKVLPDTLQKAFFFFFLLNITF
jgi:hypothetical protein